MRIWLRPDWEKWVLRLAEANERRYQSRLLARGLEGFGHSLLPPPLVDSSDDDDHLIPPLVDSSDDEDEGIIDLISPRRRLLAYYGLDSSAIRLASSQGTGG